MLKKTVIKHFNGVVKVSEALEISHSSVSQWGDVIPEKQALKLDKITNGKLKYSSEHYKNTF